MFEVVRYRVQAWRKRDGAFVPAGDQEFRDMERALRLGAAIKNTADGVAVYRLQGWPVQNLWREPVVVARYGEVPATPQ